MLCSSLKYFAITVSVHLKCIKGKKSGSREISVWDENIVKVSPINCVHFYSIKLDNMHAHFDIDG